MLGAEKDCDAFCDGLTTEVQVGWGSKPPSVVQGSAGGGVWTHSQTGLRAVQGTHFWLGGEGGPRGVHRRCSGTRRADGSVGPNGPAQEIMEIHLYCIVCIVCI